MFLLPLLGLLKPWDTPDDVGAKIERLSKQLIRPGVSNDSLLREGDHLHPDDPLEFLLQLQKYFNGLQPVD